MIVHRICAETATVSHGTSHVTTRQVQCALCEVTVTHVEWHTTSQLVPPVSQSHLSVSQSPSLSVSPPVSQSVPLPVSQSPSQSVSPPVSQSVPLPVSQSPCQSVSPPPCQPVPLSVSQSPSLSVSPPASQSVSPPPCQPVPLSVSQSPSLSASPPVSQSVPLPVSQSPSQSASQSPSQSASQSPSLSVPQSAGACSSFANAMHAMLESGADPPASRVHQHTATFAFCPQFLHEGHVVHPRAEEAVSGLDRHRQVHAQPARRRDGPQGPLLRRPHH